MKNRPRTDRLPLLATAKKLWQRLRGKLRNRKALKPRSKSLPLLLSRYGIGGVQKGELPQRIIFIVIDCLRRDHLSLSGYHRNTTPFLDSLASESAFFEKAVATSSWTFPSVASILTGLYPHNHGGDFEGDLRNQDGDLPCNVRDEVLFLPEILSARGYDTLLISGIATAELAMMGRFREVIAYYGDAGGLIKEVKSWLNRHKTSPSFIYIHLADLHAPLLVKEPHRSFFGEIQRIPNVDFWDFQYGVKEGDHAFEEYRENRVKLYDSTLRFVDEQISRLFKYLRDEKLMESTWIVITSDHGEEFWEHAEMEKVNFFDPRGYYGVGHGHNLFQEVIDVPLLLTGKGIPTGSHNHPVSLVDLVPTLLELMGIRHEIDLDGHNLFGSQVHRVILSEGIAYGYEKKAIIKGPWKLLCSEGDGVAMLFNLGEDPRERFDVSEKNPEIVKELKAFIPKTATPGEKMKIDRDIRERLRSLGYL